jgi:hypothetical protein
MSGLKPGPISGARARTEAKARTEARAKTMARATAKEEADPCWMTARRARTMAKR